MTVTISKPAINIREKLTEASAVVQYEQRQFHFDNLVTNGTFDTDTSGWTVVAGTPSVSSGQLVLDPADHLDQEIATVAGNVYLVSVGCVSTTASFSVKIGTTSGGTQIANFTSPFISKTGTTETATFVATGTSTFISVKDNSASNSTVDNISVYTSDGTDVAFTMPKGWKPLHVYDDGVLQREGSAEDYEVTFDGFNYYVKPTVANPGARNTVIGVRA